MRILMLIGSLAMVGSGIFCFANGSAAFISVAFIIGLVFCIMGVLEIVTGTRARLDAFGSGVSLATDGIIMFFFGAVILSGQIADDVTAQMLFALWMLIEAMLALGGGLSQLYDKVRADYTESVLGVAMFLIGIYTFFNTRLLNINAIILVGASILILGLRRFKITFDVEFNRQGFLTGNKEKLEEAIADEKRALAKAKEGIKEQKEAQRRIEKLREEIAQEQSMLSEASQRKQQKENEKKFEEK